jgi:beta-glucosidase
VSGASSAAAAAGAGAQAAAGAGAGADARQPSPSDASSPFRPGTFTWIAGIEDTIVYPPARFEMAPLDEHVLTGHDIGWRADLDTVAALGATALRYGVDWPRVHTAPGVFDWSVIDERLRYAHALGITVIADLVHYGTPTWLEESFTDPAYPEAIAAFAGAFAARYAGVVDHLTPLNEPITTASFAGLRGIWPPALSGWDGWTRVVLGIAEGMQRSVAAVRAANPAAVIVHVEASSLFGVEAGEVTPELHAEATLLNELGTVPTDLLLGHVVPGHRSYDWLRQNGATAQRLAGLADGAATIDLLGVNYYPDLTPRSLVDGADGTVQHAHNRWTDGLREALSGFAARYGLPMIVTETSIEGPVELRAAWLRASAEALQELASQGVDVRGFTWWPVFDFVDWSYASGGHNVEEFTLPPELVAARRASSAKEPYLRRMGLVQLDERADGRLARTPTEAAAVYRALATAATQPS